MSKIKTTGKKSSNTLVRDLITIGIFEAVYLIIITLIAFVGYVPSLMIFVTMFTGFATSIPVFLFFAKIERKVMCCTIFCSIFGAIMFATGHHVSILILSILAGLLAGGLLKAFDNKFVGYMGANMATSIAPSSMLVPLWIATEEYLEYSKSMTDASYLAFLEDISHSNWPLAVTFIGGFVGTFLGSFVAKRVMRKHFKRIGLVG